MSKTKRFWARWYGNPKLGARDEWPPELQAWCSGEASLGLPVLRIYCGLVDAVSQEAAEGVVLGCYEEGGCEIDYCEEVPLDWLPSDRFPGAKPYAAAGGAA